MPVADTIKSQTTDTAAGRLIFGLMFFTVLFALVSDEIGAAGGTNPTPKVPAIKIIIGGTVATSLLTLLSHAGDAGEKFATGLALIAFASGTLVYGKPVWDAANKAFGTGSGNAYTTLATNSAGGPTALPTEPKVQTPTNEFIAS